MYKKILHKFLALLISGVALTSTSLVAQTVEIASYPGTSGNIVTGSSNYHISESIFLASEIGTSNFTTTGTAIDRLEFNTLTVGAPTSFSNYKVYMQEVPSTISTFVTGTYSTTGYTLVYSGSIDFPATGWSGINLSTPFTRLSGTSNLQVLIERLDGVAHTGYLFASARGNKSGVAGDSALSTTRRYNLTTAPVQPQSLTVSTFRLAIRFIHRSSNDAALTGLTLPTFASCRTQLDLPVVITNAGTAPLGIGAASVSLTLSGANSYTGTQTNTTQIDGGFTGTVNFGPLNIPNPGITNIVAIVSVLGDGNQANDTIRGSFTNLNTITNYPAVEDVDDTLPLFANIRTLVGARNLWGLSAGYSNPDMVAALLDSLKPQNGDGFFLFDAWSGTSSVGFRGIVHSRCLSLPPTTAGFEYDINFWMSHDTLYSTSLDSIYLVLSLDKGATWTRLQGYQRYSALFVQPGWKKENVSLAAYAGQTIMLGFEGVSDYGNVIGIDNITIRANDPLPVNLVNFTGIKSDNNNVLSWTTLTENNNAGFELQRSADGFNFSKLGFVESKSRSGNSTNELTYGFTDNNTFASGNYYRLKQLDKDGRSSLSNVVYIKGSKATSIRITSVYPNPVINKLNLTVAAPSTERVTVMITDVTGKLIMQTTNQLKEGDNNLQLNVEGLAKGVYSLKVNCLNGCSSNILKFVK